MRKPEDPRPERPLVDAHFEGCPGLSRAARAELLALQPATVREALAVTGVGRKTTAHLLVLGLISDPDGMQQGRPRERPLPIDGSAQEASVAQARMAESHRRPVNGTRHTAERFGNDTVLSSELNAS